MSNTQWLARTDVVSLANWSTRLTAVAKIAWLSPASLCQKVRGVEWETGHALGSSLFQAGLALCVPVCAWGLWISHTTPAPVKLANSPWNKQFTWLGPLEWDGARFLPKWIWIRDVDLTATNQMHHSWTPSTHEADGSFYKYSPTGRTFLQCLWTAKVLGIVDELISGAPQQTKLKQTGPPEARLHSAFQIQQAGAQAA